LSANVTTLTVHVVVLAAGRGSRLGALGGATPKWLLPVAGRPIADRPLEGLGLAGPAVGSVSVVTGHAWPMPSSRWVEIDDDADLEVAHALAGGV
jgi:CTP:molybdopterin cytidylyltransferase MocA